MATAHWGNAFSLGLGLLALAGGALGIGQDTCVTFKSSSSTFSIVSSKKATPILISPDEWPGVQRTAFDFVTDIHSVTSVKPTLTNVTSSKSSYSSYGSSVIIVGTLGQSSLIEKVVNYTSLDVSSIEGHWEAFLAKKVDKPLPGIDSAYVIIGSDKRGTIYALYDHSEQFGVSPWYWWADVPTTQHSDLYVDESGCSHGSPTVKYRGIFLNDEQPALQNWAMEKFTNGTGAALTDSPFNHFFYSKLFELILRMKANYLWPAMWTSAFGVDDTENQPLADWYGIVMGTSHEEPCMRSIPVEWDLFGNGTWDYGENQENVYNFWKVGIERAKPYENVITIGMRGAGDLPLSEGQNIELMEQIVSDQRQLFQDVYNITDVTTLPQVWTLYKEVQGYYEAGMRVPDDVVLMWTDDNWGNIRRYPLIDERNRTGGAGVYYHIDFVGDPRDYKWITSSQIEKTFDQMSTAVARNATQIWILNVGDLKPYEMHTEFFLTYGYDADKWNPYNLQSFVSQWAQREFDVSASDALEIAGIITNVTRHNTRRKPELWNSTTYSLTNYREAEGVLDMLSTTLASANKIYNELSSDYKPAFFQLVQHPVQASNILANMWISAGINNLRASQARVSANTYKDNVETLFDEDYALEVDYHSILDGKWDHMMDQTHVMYYYWQQPMANTMPFVTKVQAKKLSLGGIMRVVVEGSLGAWPGDDQNNCAQGYSCPDPSISIDPYLPAGNRYVDIGLGGPDTFTWSATSNVSWVKLSATKGTITTSKPEERVYLSVDWSNVTETEAALITFTSDTKDQDPTTVTVTLTANHTVVPSDFTGFVEGDGCVSIEAAHASRNTSVDGLTWIEIPNYGRTVSGVTPWPRGGNELNYTAGNGPSIEYDFYLFNTYEEGGNVTITTLVAPSLNGLSDSQPLGIALQIDDGDAQTSYYMPATPSGATEPADWDGVDGWVANSIIEVPMVFDVQPGAHTLKVWMIEPTVIVQKIVIDTGGVLASYLGPPESIRV